MNGLGQIVAFWRELSPQRRLLALVAGVLVLVVIIGVLGLESRGPRYMPLFTDLETKDAADIVARLDERKIPYKLAANGKAIEVPEPLVHKTRLELASEGLPQSGVVGLEIMGNFNLGATDFDKRVQYQRAIQGELVRTILQIDGVQTARVHLNVPEPSPFVREKRPATAAILLSLRPGARLEPAQVRGVAHLVAGSVEGLKPEDVTVLNENGQILGADDLAGSDGAGNGATVRNLRVQEEFQQKLERSVQSLLESVLGTGNVVTRVTAELNFNQQTLERELFEPINEQDGVNEGIVRRYTELKETFEGPPGDQIPTGTAGNNVDTYPVTVTNGEGVSRFEKTQQQKEYEINRIKEQVAIAPGAVKRLSVSVVVNRRLSANQEEQIRQLVIAAVGSDAQRRDQVTVTGLPFNTPLEVKQPEAPVEPAAPVWVRYAVYGGSAGALLLAFLVAMFIGRRRTARDKAKLAEDLLELQQQATLELAKQSGPSAEAMAAQALQTQVATLAKEKPDEVAQIIRSWLNED